MALSRLKNWVAEVLTFSDLNSEFNNILNNANTLISPSTANIAMGGYKLTGLAAGSTAGDSVRWEDSGTLPQNSQSAAYTTVLSDASKHILHPTSDNNARTFTIDSNANVAYPTGTTITFVNQINTVTIAITSDTLTMAGTGSTGSRTLAASGIAVALKISSTNWIINGSGLS